MKKINILILLFGLSVAGFAQQGLIKGRVFDSKNNEALPFTNIIIEGTTIGASSDFEGNFIIAGVEPGFYRLKASSVGYSPYISEEFQLSNNRPVYIEMPLQQANIELNGVIIKAPIFERRDESPLAMQTIGISEIEKNPGGNRDISKVIQAFPGVGQTAVYRNDLIVRGGGANENRFYIDGIEFPNLNHFATQGASGGPAGIINTDFIKQVDFYTGSFSSNQGNALSSVLDMTLINPNNENTAYRLTLGASDFGLTFNGPLSKNSGLLVSVRRSYLQFLFQAIGLPFLPTYNDYLVKYKINLSERSQLSIISLGAFDINRLNLERNETEQQRYILDYLPETDQWNYTIGAVYKRFNDDGYNNIILSRNMFRNRSMKYIGNIKEDSLLTQDYTSDEIENKFRFERVIFGKKYRLLYGLSSELATYSNTTYQKIFSNGSFGVLNYNSDLSIIKYGAFAQYTRKFVADKLSLSLGLRMDGNTYSTEMQNPINQLSPRLALSYRINGRLSFSASLARYNQLPAYTTLGYRDSLGTLINKVNGLKYIKSDQIIAGLEYQPDENSRISLEGFYKFYSQYPLSLADSVSIANKGGDFGVVGDEAVVSSGNGRAYGFEILARRKVLDQLSLLMSYTFVRSEFSDFDNNYIPSSWDSRHIVNLLALVNFRKHWSIGIKWKFSGGAPYTPYDLESSSLVQAWNSQGRAYPDYSQFNSQRLKSFHQLDLRIDKEYYFKKWSLNLYFDIQNAYNFQAQGQDFLVRETDPVTGLPIIVNPSDPIESQRYQLKYLKNTSGNVLPTLGIIIEL